MAVATVLEVSAACPYHGVAEYCMYVFNPHFFVALLGVVGGVQYEILHVVARIFHYL